MTTHPLIWIPIILVLCLAFLAAMVAGAQYLAVYDAGKRAQSYAEKSYYEDMCWEEAQRRGYTEKSYLYDFQPHTCKIVADNAFGNTEIRH